MYIGLNYTEINLFWVKFGGVWYHLSRVVYIKFGFYINLTRKSCGNNTFQAYVLTVVVVFVVGDLCLLTCNFACTLVIKIWNMQCRFTVINTFERRFGLNVIPSILINRDDCNKYHFIYIRVYLRNYLVYTVFVLKIDTLVFHPRNS